MTIVDLAHRRAHRESHPRLAEKVSTFGTLLADSIRLANALDAAPTAESRQKLTDRFVEAHRAA